DVDDVIWNEDRLGEDDDTLPPAWLADEAVCAGIAALLEKDHCEEELEWIQ
ncbi:hypothetical protein M422DRAFT_86209, partial [Sphaerobolus stellatus SS14]